MTYKAIGFDYGGVIRGQPGIYFEQAVCAELGISHEKYAEAYYKNNHKRNLGNVSWDDFWSEFVADFGGTPLQAVRIREIGNTKHRNINQNIVDLITTLRNSGYLLGLYSNNTREAADDMRARGIDTHFDVFWVSGEVGYMKPDPEGFRKFFAALGAKPEESIFIDDATKSLSTADEIGFTPILYRTYEGLVGDLKRLGISF